MQEVFDEFLHLLLDPAHTMVEFTFVAIDYAIIHTVVSRWRKHFHKDQGLADDHAPVVH